MSDVVVKDIEYWMKKRRGRKTGFPVASIAYYAETDQCACKVVLGIQRSTGADPELRKWSLESGDVRKDTQIISEIYRHLLDNQVERIAELQTIFGCPHEEGIDYPEGESCPRCPFWEGRDRFSGELRR